MLRFLRDRLIRWIRAVFFSLSKLLKIFPTPGEIFAFLLGLLLGSKLAEFLVVGFLRWASP